MQQDPQHPLLKHERAPVECGEDGSRPRIVSEAARLAQLAHLARQLAAAKEGQGAAPEDRCERVCGPLQGKRGGRGRGLSAC